MLRDLLMRLQNNQPTSDLHTANDEKIILRNRFENREEEIIYIVICERREANAIDGIGARRVDQ